MLEVWDSFVPLLREADEIVCCSLPSASKTIDSMFSVLLHEFENVLSEASSGLFLNPRENSQEMVAKLSHICAHVHSLAAKLEHLSRDIQNLKGELPHLQLLTNSSFSQADNCYCFQLEIPVDLSILTAGIQLVEARKQLWELLAVVRAWMDECQELHICEVTLGNASDDKYILGFLMLSTNHANEEAYRDLCIILLIYPAYHKIYFFQDVVSQAQSKMANWKEKALSLTCVIPAHDPVMQECLRILENFNHHLRVVAKLQSPILKQKHLRAICEGQKLCPALL